MLRGFAVRVEVFFKVASSLAYIALDNIARPLGVFVGRGVDCSMLC